MRNDNIANLTEQLNRVCIIRDCAVQRISETIEARMTEIALLARIRTRRTTIVATAAAVNGYTIDAEQYRRGNIFVIGDTEEITNNLRDKLVTMGVVTTSGCKFVKLRNITTRKRYTTQLVYVRDCRIWVKVVTVGCAVLASH